MSGESGEIDVHDCGEHGGMFEVPGDRLREMSSQIDAANATIARLTEMLTVIALDVGCQCLEGTGADDGNHTSWFCIHLTEALDIAEGKS